MPDKDNQTNTTTDAPQQEEAEVEQPAETEETAPETEDKSTETQEETPDQEEDIDLEQYSRSRYQAAPKADSQDMVEEVAKELSQLPTDETGTVEARAAAEWFANKLSQVGGKAEQAAVARAESAAMAILSESAQQQQLLKKYPEITKDKDTLDAVFDLRDAAALRGQNLSLTEAAGRLDKLRQQGKAEGTQTATRRTTIQAAAHLETSSTKGEPTSDRERLAQVAYQGSGQEAINARRELLKQFVQNEIKEGRIQEP